MAQMVAVAAGRQLGREIWASQTEAEPRWSGTPVSATWKRLLCAFFPLSEKLMVPCPKNVVGASSRWAKLEAMSSKKLRLAINFSGSARALAQFLVPLAVLLAGGQALVSCDWQPIVCG